MKCNKIKDIILTDFADGELEPELKKKIEGHIASCEECRRVYEALKGEVLEPIRSSGRKAPPESLWMNVKEEIEAEEKEPAFSNLLDWFKEVTLIRRPALVAAAAAVIIATGLFLRLSMTAPSASDVYLSEQVYFLDYLDEGNGFSYPDLGIPIEDIFQ